MIKSTQWRNAITLMRIPFSVFLMPVFWFSLLLIPEHDIVLWRVAVVFLVYHLLVYPASNGYNSYFDKDEGAIGGLEKPPPVNPKLFQLTIVFDVLALAISSLIDPLFGLLTLLYILVSKAYSWKKTRLKRYPIWSYAVVIIFQGGFTYLTFQQGILGEIPWSKQNTAMALAASLFLAGSYPITQVYQHKEDAARGDKTISLLLGVKGTFLLAGTAFFMATAIIASTWLLARSWEIPTVIFLFFGSVVAVFMTKWVVQIWKNPLAADFYNTMKMNKISSISLSLAFILIRIYLSWPR